MGKGEVTCQKNDGKVEKLPILGAVCKKKTEPDLPDFTCDVCKNIQHLIEENANKLNQNAEAQATAQGAD